MQQAEPQLIASLKKEVRLLRGLQILLVLVSVALIIIVIIQINRPFLGIKTSGLAWLSSLFALSSLVVTWFGKPIFREYQSLNLTQSAQIDPTQQVEPQETAMMQRLKNQVGFDSVPPDSVLAIKKLPYVVGIANWMGHEANIWVEEDKQFLSKLFRHVNDPGYGKVSTCDILFVYAMPDENGSLVTDHPPGTDNQSSDRTAPTLIGLCQLAQITKAKIVILASNTPIDKAQALAGIDGPKIANMVITLERGQHRFANFFKALFIDMAKGEDMMMAWVKLAPQGPQDNPEAPATIMISGLGRIKFQA